LTNSLSNLPNGSWIILVLSTVKIEDCIAMGFSLFQIFRNVQGQSIRPIAGYYEKKGGVTLYPAVGAKISSTIKTRHDKILSL